MTKKPTRIPDWSTQPFYRFLEYVENEARLVHLAAHGIHGLVRARGLAEALYGVDILDEDPKEATERLHRGLETAEVAEAEVKAEFPLLHAHSLMGIWGALEALVDDVVVAWLAHRKALMQEGEFASVRVPVGTFQRLTVSERIRYLLDQVPRPAGVGGGLPRFELLLDRVGLGGAVEDGLRRSLIEVHQVRNLYAHHGGIADRKAIAACPWRTDWRLNQPVRVGHVAYERYVKAINDYLLILISRTGTQFGVDVSVGLEERAARQRDKRRREERNARRRRLAAARRRREKKAKPDGGG